MLVPLMWMPIGALLAAPLWGLTFFLLRRSDHVRYRVAALISAALVSAPVILWLAWQQVR
jgi:hypothetical protein